MDHKQYQKKILLELMKLEEFNEYFEPVEKIDTPMQKNATVKIMAFAMFPLPGVLMQGTVKTQGLKLAKEAVPSMFFSFSCRIFGCPELLFLLVNLVKPVKLAHHRGEPFEK